MEEKKTSEASDENKNPQTPLTGDKIDDASTDPGYPQKEENCIHQIEKKADEDPHIRVWFLENWDKVVSNFVQIILAVFTFLLFRQALTQSSAARDSANAALKADSLTEISLERQNNSFVENLALAKAVADSTDSNNNRLLAFYKQSLKSNDDATKKAYDLQRRNLENQQKDINEKQREFTISNRPFLSLNDIKLDSLELGQHSTITYNLFNSGKFPAKVTSIKEAFDVKSSWISNGQIVDFFNNLNEVSFLKQNGVNNVIASTTFIPMTLQAIQVNDNNIQYGFKQGLSSCVFYFKVEYSDYILKTSYTRILIYKITPMPKLDIQQIFDEEQ